MIMGEVLIKYRIMPESAEQDMDKLLNDVKGVLQGVDIRNIVEQPIAFGLRALEMMVVLPDSGGAEEVERSLEGVKGVQSVSVVEMDLL